MYCCTQTLYQYKTDKKRRYISRRIGEREMFRMIKVGHNDFMIKWNINHKIYRLDDERRLFFARLVEKTYKIKLD